MQECIENVAIKRAKIIQENSKETGKKVKKKVAKN